MEPDAIADLLTSAQELAACDFETEFEVRKQMQHRVDPTDRTGANEPESFEVFRYVAVGARLRVERTSYQAPPGDPAPSVRYRSCDIWADGMRHTTWPDEPGQVSLSPTVSSGDMHGRGLLFNLVEGRFGDGHGLADRVRASEPVERTVDDGVLTYHFEQPGAIARFTVVVRLEPRVEILRFRLEMDRPDRGTTLAHEYRVEEWETAGAVRLPHLASLTIGGTRPDGAPSSCRIEYRRRSFRAVTDLASVAPLLAQPFAPGASVYDGRYDLAFTIGQTKLHFDGAAFELDEPITTPPTGRLEGLLGAARRIGPFFPPATAGAPTVAPSWSGERTHSFGTVAPTGCSPLTHVFELRNDADRPARVLKIGRGCGASTAGADCEVMAPGESVRVTAGLAALGTGRHQAEILLVTDHPVEPEVRLTLEACVRRRQALRVHPLALALTGEHDGELVVIVDEYASDETPAAPVVTADATWLDTDFRGWRFLHPRDERTALPARWEGTVAVRAADDAPPGAHGRLSVAATSEDHASVVSVVAP